MSGFSFRVDNSPFNQQQADALNQLLATLTPEQMIWLSGYLAGLRSSAAGKSFQPESPQAAEATPGAAVVAAASPAVEREVTILHGSQTGNAQRLAGEMKKRLEEKDFQVTLSCMSDFRTNNLKKIKQLLIVVSTYGEGDPPDKAVLFHEFMHGKRAPRLEGMKFSVLSLGDQLYEHFCKIGQGFRRAAGRAWRRANPRRGSIATSISTKPAKAGWTACWGRSQVPRTRHRRHAPGSDARAAPVIDVAAPVPAELLSSRLGRRRRPRPRRPSPRRSTPA